MKPCEWSNVRITDVMYKAKSIKQYRASLRSIVDDDRMWNNVESLARLVTELKATIDDFT